LFYGQRVASTFSAEYSQEQHNRFKVKQRLQAQLNFYFKLDYLYQSTCLLSYLEPFNHDGLENLKKKHVFDYLSAIKQLSFLRFISDQFLRFVRQKIK
jgi:hypothetical protein